MKRSSKKNASAYLSFFKSKQGITALILAAVLFVGVLAVGITAAYRRQNEYDNSVEAAGFYFTLDLLGDTLTDDSLSRTVHLYGGNAKLLPFTVQNYFDSLRVTERDTAYTVSLTASGATASLSESGSFSLVGGSAKEQALTLSVDAGYSDGATVTVTVASSSPYEKVMQLVFILHTYDAPLTWRIEDTAGVLSARLIIMTNVDIEMGKLSFDWSDAETLLGVSQATANILQVDSNNTYVKGNPIPVGGYLKALIVQKKLSAGQSIAIDFMKLDPDADYSIAENKTYPDGEGNFNVIADFS